MVHGIYVAGDVEGDVLVQVPACRRLVAGTWYIVDGDGGNFVGIFIFLYSLLFFCLLLVHLPAVVWLFFFCGCSFWYFYMYLYMVQ